MWDETHSFRLNGVTVLGPLNVLPGHCLFMMVFPTVALWGREQP